MIEDPDIEELNEASTIHLFVPGQFLEREISGGRMLVVMGVVGLALVGMTLITLLLIVPLMQAGLVEFDYVHGTIRIAPEAFLTMTMAELFFLVAVLGYVRYYRLPLSSVGFKTMSFPRESLLGLGVGGVMLLANIAVNLFVYTASGSSPESVDMLLAPTPAHLLAWVLVMFLVVGLAEEALFRGLLQRRMEMFLRRRTASNRSWALVISSFIFAAVHGDILGIPSRFVLGLFLGLLAQKTRYSLVAPTVAHGLNNSVVVLLSYLGF
ncbi:MAG: CPBP family intramembrane glutamic endopeptidase [Candidatus Thorarchaeota archaeon]